MSAKGWPKHAAEYLRSHAIPMEAIRAAKVVYDGDSDSLKIPFNETEGQRRYLNPNAPRRFESYYPWNAVFSSPLFFAPLPPSARLTWDKVKSTPTIAIYWAEGPFKALANSWLTGHPTIAANGLDGWRPSNPSADFRNIQMKKREWVILVDSDAAAKPEARQSIRRLWDFLEFNK